MMMTVAKASQKATTAARRSVHQTSFLNALGQAWVRSTTHRCPAVSGAGAPRAAMSPCIPRAASRWRVRPEVIPAIEMDRDRGPAGDQAGANVSRVGSSNGESGRLAGAATLPSGMPRGVDDKRALEALLAPVDRAASGDVPTAGRDRHAAVDGEVAQVQADQAIIGREDECNSCPSRRRRSIHPAFAVAWWPSRCVGDRAYAQPNTRTGPVCRRRRDRDP